MSSPSGPPWHLTETYKGLITISVEALKMLAIVNGGAAVAVLTYLGNLVSHAGASPPNIRWALVSYCGGLLATILAFLCSYLTQLALFNEEMGRRSKFYRHQWWLWAGVILALTSAAAFGWGCWIAANALAP